MNIVSVLKSAVLSAGAAIVVLAGTPAAKATQSADSYLTVRPNDYIDSHLTAFGSYIDAVAPGLPPPQVNRILDDFATSLLPVVEPFGPDVPIGIVPNYNAYSPANIGSTFGLDLSNGRAVVGTDGPPLPFGSTPAPEFAFLIPAEFNAEFSATADMFATNPAQLRLQLSNVTPNDTGFDVATNFRIIPMLGFSAFEGEQYLDAWAAFLFHDAAMNFALNVGDTININVLDFWVAIQEALADQGLGAGNPDYAMSFIVVQDETVATASTTELAILQGLFFDTPETSDLALTRSGTTPAFLQSAPTFDAQAPTIALNVPAPPALSVFLVGLVGLAGLRRRMRTA